MASENDHWYVGTNKDTQGAKTKTGKGSVNKDPLPYDVKIKAMEALWPEIAGHILPESSMLTLASKIYDIHGGDVNLIAYTDEAWIIDVLKKYNGQIGPHGYYDFHSVTNKPTPRLSSATDVRLAVSNNDKQAFTSATGVAADTDIDGTSYFDLVAKYLALVKESPTTDKYIQQTGNHSMENMNSLRKLAGMPPMKEDTNEGAVPYYSEGKNAMLVRKIGMALANMAVAEDDVEESERMAKISQAIEGLDFKHGDPLEQVLTRIKLDDPQVLAKYLKMGLDGVKRGLDDVSHVDDRKKGAQGGPMDQEDPEDEFAAQDADWDNEKNKSKKTSAAVGNMEPIDDVEDPDVAAADEFDRAELDEMAEMSHSQSVDQTLLDLGDIRSEYSISEEEESPEDELYRLQQAEIAVQDAYNLHGNPEGLSREDYLKKLGTIAQARADLDQELHGVGDMGEAVTETAQNAMDAAIAELRKLAGI